MKPVIEIPSEGTIVLYHSRLKTMEKFVDWKCDGCRDNFPRRHKQIFNLAKKKFLFFTDADWLRLAISSRWVWNWFQFKWPVELMLFNYFKVSNFMTVDRKLPRYCGLQKDLKMESDGAFFRVTFKSNDRFDGTGFYASYQFTPVADAVTITRRRSSSPASSSPCKKLMT